MLGLADRVRVIDLFEALMRGDIAASLKELREQYDIGADPAVVLSDLAEFNHFVTRVKVVPAVADDPSLAEAERTRGRALAARLSMGVLSRTWQMLLNSLPDVQAAAKPIAAAEMVLVRIAYATNLPSPEEVIRSLGDGDAARSSAAPRDAGAPNSVGTAKGFAASAALPAAAPAQRLSAASSRLATAPTAEPNARLDSAPAQPAVSVARFEDLIALAVERRDLMVKTALERDVRLVRFEDGRLEVALEPGAAKTLVGDLARKLSNWTGRRWMVIVSAEEGAPTVRAQAERSEAELKRGVAGEPLVQAVLSRFPGAEIVAVRQGDQAAPTSPAAAVPPGDLDEPANGEPLPDETSHDH
jgi:DNA polymerase-3 subunit gamma/tau